MRCRVSNFVVYNLHEPSEREIKPVVECEEKLYFPSPEGFEKLKEILGSEIENLYLDREIELPKKVIKAYL